MFTLLVADVRGGGISGQAQAIVIAASAALQNYDRGFAAEEPRGTSDADSRVRA